MAHSFESEWRGHRRRHAISDARGPAYDYCEAYFDDYYRTYTRPATTYPSQSYVPAPVQQISPPREVEIEEYVPVRTRSIPPRHRPRSVPDKRIRVQ